MVNNESVWMASNSSLFANESHNATAETDSKLQPFLETLHLYYTPLIVLLGTCGNVASIVTLLLTKLRAQSPSQYLIALAASDTGFLFSQLIPWLDNVGVHLFVVNGICQLTQYVGNCCSFLSAWLVVAFTVERCVAVCYPLHRARLCTVHRAQTLVGLLCLVAVVANSYTLVIVNVLTIRQDDRDALFCDVDHERHRSASFCLMGADVVVTLVLPFLLIVVLNIRIARAVCRLELTRRMMYVTSSHDGAAAAPQPRATSQQITKMLLVVSSVFLLLNLPFYVLRVWAFVLAVTNIHAQVADWVTGVQVAATCLLQLNFAINFLLYCVSGQNFRRAVSSLCCRHRRALGSRASSTRTEHVPLTSLCRHPTHSVTVSGTPLCRRSGHSVTVTGAKLLPAQVSLV